MPDERHLQDAASNLEAGSAERQVKARFAARRSECDVWQFGLPAAGPIRPSLPWCCGAARRTPPARRSKPLGSWQCRTAGKGKVCS